MRQVRFFVLLFLPAVFLVFAFNNCSDKVKKETDEFKSLVRIEGDQLKVQLGALNEEDRLTLEGEIYSNDKIPISIPNPDPKGDEPRLPYVIPPFAHKPKSGIFSFTSVAKRDLQDFQKGQLISVQWADLQKGEDTFDFSAFSALKQDCNKCLFLEIRGERKPEFLKRKVPYLRDNYSSGVPKGTYAYWHPNYKKALEKVISRTMEHLKAKFMSDTFLTGMIVNHNAIGTSGFFNLVQDVPAKSKWIVPQGVAYVPFTLELNEDFKFEIRQFYSLNLPRIETANYGPRLFQPYIEPGSVDLGDRVPYHNIVFSNPGDIANVVDDSAFLAKGLNEGSAIVSQFKKMASNCRDPFVRCLITRKTSSDLRSQELLVPNTAATTLKKEQIAKRWNYWNLLFSLHYGFDYISLNQRDLDKQMDQEYLNAFDFFQKYAGFRRSAMDSPGAWIAFKGRDALAADFSFLIDLEDSSDADFVPLDITKSGSELLGGVDQKEGLWARKLLGGKTIRMKMRDEFSGSLYNRRKKVKVVYLDQGRGSLRLNAFGEEHILKIEEVEGEENIWRSWEVEFNKPHANSEISLTAGDEADVVLHMIEVERGAWMPCQDCVKPDPKNKNFSLESHTKQKDLITIPLSNGCYAGHLTFTGEQSAIDKFEFGPGVEHRVGDINDSTENPVPALEAAVEGGSLSPNLSPLPVPPNRQRFIIEFCVQESQDAFPPPPPEPLPIEEPSEPLQSN